MNEIIGGKEGQRAYWNEHLRQHWGPEGASSLTLGRQFNLWRYRVRRRVFRRLVRRLALRPANLSVLDVGSGTGFFVKQWLGLGVKTFAGLDISDWAVGQLMQAYPKGKFYRADISALPSPLPPEAFDAVTAMDVLVHLVDDAAYLSALHNLARALKPGGYLFYSDAFFHGADKQWEDYWKGRSLSFVTAAMRDSSLEIISRVPRSVVMSAPTDTRHRETNERLWERLIVDTVRRGEWIGFLVGAVLYPLELVLVSTLRESPAIEIMICRKS